MSLIGKLWRDEVGSLLSTEYLVLGALLTIGLVVGISAAQNAIVTELDDFAQAIRGLDDGGLGTPSDDPVTFTGGESGTFGP